ncbi:MAG: UDP-glucose 4-epimerase GalE [Pseudomonadales bacterium]
MATEVLVTGGAGYIGSHMCVELLQAGYDVVVVDNYSNSSPRSLTAVERITQKRLTAVEADLRDADAIRALFANHEFAAVLHFGGLKAVGESVARPLLYYDNNINGTLCLLQAMQDAGVKTLVFSSSATVYGMPETVPISESAPIGAINPYGRTKQQIEDILRDLHAADDAWRISILRYFNPTGAHPSGEIGEDPNDIPNNLMPNIARVAVGRMGELRVFGDDYPTVDGTCIRDYIHVMDLVQGHLKALEHLQNHRGLSIHNLGTGTGYSVLQMIEAFGRACGHAIPYRVTARRAGDAAVSFADPSRANAELGWTAKLGLDEMCRDVWRWQQKHPDGYGAS